MLEHCEAEFIQVGDRTVYGPVVKVETIDQMTTLTFDTGDFITVPDDTEMTVIIKETA